MDHSAQKRPFISVYSAKYDRPLRDANEKLGSTDYTDFHGFFVNRYMG